jgi:glycosyltransferase involved in cell wall biosynthesis
VADRLHIGVDGRELVGRPTGVGRYLIGILRAWSADPAFPHRVTLFLPAPPPDAVKALGPRFGVQVELAARAGTLWEQTRLPAAAARANVDVFFAAGYTGPLRLKCPFVVAVYDVSFFAHREWFPWRQGVRRRWLTRAAAKRASAVVTISEFSANEVVRWLGIARQRIRVAPPGSPERMPAPAAADRGQVVLFVGSLLNRRRLPELIQGFALAAARLPNARLVLVGDNRAHPPIDPRALAAAWRVGHRVEWREYATDAELQALYSSARVFAFLSDYEGFAMTPLEAMAHGTPAVLLDTPVAREIYGDAARLVPPDPARIGDALAVLLSDDAAHAKLVSAGGACLARYSWSRSAAIVRAALEQAVRP